ncbi:MAG: DNA cytosine methyltransferase [Azoarcus sp.]|jgi:site-specific DNA-cytosine methylase|nr:DNA cytosine methyltransferase [Azoarcus sp.]
MIREIRHFHLFCGLGGGARGFNRASPRVGNMTGWFRCLGGIDVDTAAIRDFGRFAGVPGTVIDLFDRDQYRDFHGVEPPADWHEATPADIRRAAGGEYPNIVFLSAPCKGFSGLLSETRSRTAKYQALNRLTLRGVWLMLEAFSGDPPGLIVFENVPRIANRGRHLLDQIGELLRAYGYAVAETTHDCGEIGGLAQSRKRFLLVARHIERVPPFLYEPEKKRLTSVSTVLRRMPMPGDPAGGPMHRVPSLAWKTWVRLAFVEAGSDWRSLNRLAVENGVLRDYVIVPDNGEGFAVRDPRTSMGAGTHQNIYRIVAWDETARTVTGASHVAGWAGCVADPHPGIADRRAGDAYVGGGHYGVLAWSQSAGAVSSAAQHDNGRWSVADPRLPEADDKLLCVIRALDGTWHRPFTTLELAALQSLIDPEEMLELDGLSDQAWRERIGNAVPPDAARAIAETMGKTMLLAWSGESFALSSVPIWVQPVAVALAMTI